jgi:hypothetical protein
LDSRPGGSLEVSGKLQPLSKEVKSDKVISDDVKSEEK